MSLIRSFGQAELLAAMIEAFGSPRPTSWALSELEWALVQAIEAAVGGGGGSNVTLTIGGNQATVDNGPAFNDLFAEGTNGAVSINAGDQIGVCWTQEPIIAPIGSGIIGNGTPQKQGGAFYVPGLRIMAGSNFNPAVPLWAQTAYGLPASVDSPVILAGISSFVRGITCDGSTSAAIGAGPGVSYGCLGYNTDLQLDWSAFRNGTQGGWFDAAGAANYGSSPVALVPGVGMGTVQSAVITGGSCTITFTAPIPAYVTNNNWGVATITGFSGYTGTLLHNPPVNISNQTTNSITFGTSATGTITVAGGAVVTLGFQGCARTTANLPIFESTGPGDSVACIFEGVDLTINGGRKLGGLAIYGSGCQGAKVTNLHHTGQGGSQTYNGNTGTWNSIVAARGSYIGCTYDTIPTGATALIALMAFDPNGGQVMFSGCEIHENTPGAALTSAINRFTGANACPIIFTGNIYGASSGNPASFGSLLDHPLSGDDITMSAAHSYFSSETAGGLWGTALPGKWSVMFSDTGTLLTNTTPTITSAQGNTTPTGTTSTGGVMMGLDQTVEPESTGKFLIQMSGNCVTTNASGVMTITLQYGTGTAPINGAAVTGTTIASTITVTPGTNAGSSWNIVGVVSNLNVLTQTTYWLDVALQSGGAYTVSISNVSFTATELAVT